MKKTFIIHPGFGKCGTTFLQRRIFLNEKILNLGRISNLPDPNRCSYPNLKIQKILEYLFEIKIFNESNLREVKKNIKVLIDEFDKLISNNDHYYIILSDERIFEFYINNLGNNIQILEILLSELEKKYNFNFLFIVSIRSQANFLFSYYSFFYNKLSKNFNSFDSFVDYAIGKSTFLENLNYEYFFKKLSRYFKIPIFFLPIDYLNYQPKDYLKILSEIFGNISVEIDKSKKVLSQNRPNKLQYEKIIPFDNKILNYLLNFLKIDKFHKKEIISANPNTMKKIYEAFENSNNQFKIRTNIDMNIYNILNRN